MLLESVPTEISNPNPNPSTYSFRAFKPFYGDQKQCESRHINLRDAVYDTAVAAGLGPVREGRFLLPGTDRRPADVLVPNWVGGKDAAMDVTVITPLQAATMPGAANTAGHALNHA